MKIAFVLFFLIGLSLNAKAQSVTTTSTTTSTLPSTTSTTLPVVEAPAPTSTTLPVIPAVEAVAATDDLTSRLLPRGFSVGYRYQYFDYHEPSPDVREHGSLNGLVGAYEKPFGADSNSFFRVEGDFLFGRISYDGHYQNGDSLNASSDDRTIGLRFNIGYSVNQANSAIRFYTGGMFRYLYDYVQAPGGYRREISQLSVPLGMTYRKSFQKFTYSLTSEFDVLLAGIVKSYLSDVGPTHSDITNRQRTGFGGKIAGSIEWQGAGAYTYIVEPSFQYWMIDDSNLDSDGTGTYLEPFNISKILNLSFIVRF